MGERIPVTLSGPATIDGKRRLPGETVDVTEDVAIELAQAGALTEGGALVPVIPGMPNFDGAVQAMSKTLADAAVQAALEAAHGQLVEDLDAARRRAQDAEDTIVRKDAEIMRHQDDLAELQSRNAALTTERDSLIDRLLALQPPNTPSGGAASDEEANEKAAEPAAPATRSTTKKGAAGK